MAPGVIIIPWCGCPWGGLCPTPGSGSIPGDQLEGSVLLVSIPGAPACSESRRVLRAAPPGEGPAPPG